MDNDLFNYTLPPMNDIIQPTADPQESQVVMANASVVGEIKYPALVNLKELTRIFDEI